MKPESPFPAGGHATSNLSDDERRTLYSAALHDQTLFDQLLEDEALREILSDPRERARIRQVFEDDRQPAWWSLFTLTRPAVVWAAAALLLVVTSASLYRWVGSGRAQDDGVRVASSERPFPGDSPQRTLEPRQSVQPSGETGRVPDSRATASTSDIASIAEVRDVQTDPAALSLASASPDPAMTPATRDKAFRIPVPGPLEVHFVPPADGKAMGVALTVNGGSVKVFPSGESEAATVKQGIPVTVTVPRRLQGSDVVEIRMVLADGAASTADFREMLAGGRAVVYSVRAAGRR